MNKKFLLYIDKNTLKKPKDYVSLHSRAHFPVVYREQKPLNTIEVTNKIEKMQGGKIDLIFHSIKGLPFQDKAEIDKTLNNSGKSIDKKT